MADPSPELIVFKTVAEARALNRLNLYSISTAKGKPGCVLDLLGKRSITLSEMEARMMAKAIYKGSRGWTSPSPSYFSGPRVYRVDAANSDRKGATRPRSSRRKPKPRK